MSAPETRTSALRVWTDGEDWIIAETAERAHELRAESYGEGPDDMGSVSDWRALPDDKPISVHDDCDDTTTVRTAAEWVAAEGEGVLCSANW